ncbi:cuticle protein 19.8 [Anastrepha obliqua]|uniref:cuticle protein 19.8 n=1 Tax=Anastrepha obliqua TaxID=95512 RepID=UPI002409090B|nr:cuticle protein 19.8 [Anastrepha obliqua]
MALRFSYFACVAVLGLLGITSAEFDYNPNVYNTNNSNNNNNNIETPNINGYDDDIQQPANSYDAPLAALNTYNNNNSKQQQQQPPVNGYNYDVNNAQQPLSNNYNNNNPQQSQQEQQQQQPQESQRNDYGYAKGAEAQPTNAIATPAGYDYKPQNYAALSSSSSASGSTTTSTNIETSFSAQGRQTFAPAAPVEEYNPPAKYEYSYSVHDDDTGDIKSHNEARDGYFVQGSYSVVDPDGFQRTVRYTVDGPSGFNAVVNRVPYALKPVVAAVGLSASPTSAAPITNIAELPLSNSALLEQSSAAASSSSISASEQADGSNSNLPVEPRDSYATPPSSSRDGKGRYP